MRVRKQRGRLQVGRDLGDILVGGSQARGVGERFLDGLFQCERVPGGAFEGTCVAMLHVHGVAIEAALAATLVARGFTFWLPIAPGLAIARREMMRGAASAGPTAGTETP